MKQSASLRARRIDAVFLSLAALLLAACGGGGSGGNSIGDGGGSLRALEIPCSQHSDARLLEMSEAGIGSTSALGLAAGRYALPASAAPTQLVVMFHGHGNDSCGWRGHLQQAADKGAIALAMDYTGQRQEPSEN